MPGIPRFSCRQSRPEAGLHHHGVMCPSRLHMVGATPDQSTGTGPVSTCRVRMSHPITRITPVSCILPSSDGCRRGRMQRECPAPVTPTLQGRSRWKAIEAPSAPSEESAIPHLVMQGSHEVAIPRPISR